MKDFKYGNAICYSGFRENQSPQTKVYPSYDEVKEDLLILEKEYDYIRMYSPSKHAEVTLQVIRDLGLDLQVMLGIDLKGEEKLTPFVRYEKYNTHADTAGSLVANQAFDKNELIFGLNYKVANGAAFKMDYQLVNNAVSGSDTSKQFNAGIAIWF